VKPPGIACLVLSALFLGLGGHGLSTSALELPWLLRRRPLLVVDERGVTDRSSPFAVGFIARDEIVAVLVCRYGFKTVLGFRVRDRSAVLARRPFLTRWVHRLLIRQAGRASFVVSCRLLRVNPEVLAQEISERYGVPAGIALPGDD
jgi:hypothetical protein